MTEDQQGDAPTATPDTAVLRRNVALLLGIGVLMVVGGLIGGLAAKASADHASLVASSPRTLPVLAHSGYFFPGAHSIVPDYTGLWIGIIVAGLGVIVLLAGIIVASAKPRAA